MLFRSSKGVQEALLLSERVTKWNVQDFFVSPLGRAQKTAELAMKNLNRKAETLNWLQEFYYPIADEKSGGKRIAWDWMPEDFYSEEKYFSKDLWHQTKAMKSGNMEEHYNEVCGGFDSVLKRYGYERKSQSSSIYTCSPNFTKDSSYVDTHLNACQKNLDDRNLVFFCHLGVMFVLLSHLTGISPVQLWQGFFVAPTSVTVLGAEERVPGEVVFRTQMLGDCTHLISNKEPPSSSGFFGNVFPY